MSTDKFKLRKRNLRKHTRVFTLEVTFGESNLKGRSELVPGQQGEELEIASVYYFFEKIVTKG